MCARDAVALECIITAQYKILLLYMFKTWSQLSFEDWNPSLIRITSKYFTHIFAYNVEHQHQQQPHENGMRHKRFVFCDANSKCIKAYEIRNGRYEESGRVQTHKIHSHLFYGFEAKQREKKNNIVNFSPFLVSFLVGFALQKYSLKRKINGPQFW